MESPRMLIVNKQPVIAEALALLIRQHTGFVTETCLTRQDVAAQIARFVPDVIVLNLHDPEMTQELQLCHTLAERSGDHTVVLLASGFLLNDTALMAEAFEAGADGALNRDTLSVEALMAALRDLAAGRSLWDKRMLRQAMQRREVAERTARAAQAFEQLTRREREVLARLARGATNYEIAEQFAISERTVQKHVSNLLTKLGLVSRTQVIALYYQHERAWTNDG